VRLAEPGGHLGQPVVGRGVVRLAAQASTADDATEGDQQLQRCGVHGGQDRLEPGDLRRQGLPEGVLVEAGQRGRLVSPGAVQDRSDDAQVDADLGKLQRHLSS
jgi:hypothetical protein